MELEQWIVRVIGYLKLRHEAFFLSFVFDPGQFLAWPSSEARAKFWGSAASKLIPRLLDRSLALPPNIRSYLLSLRAHRKAEAAVR